MSGNAKGSTGAARGPSEAGMCVSCINGTHAYHVLSLGGICIGCPCAWIPPREPAAGPPAIPLQDPKEGLGAPTREAPEPGGTLAGPPGPGETFWLAERPTIALYRSADPQATCGDVADVFRALRFPGQGECESWIAKHAAGLYVPRAHAVMDTPEQAIAAEINDALARRVAQQTIEIADLRKALAASEDKRRERALAGRCPICDAPGRIDRPDLAILNATCSACGWHYTVPASEQPRAAPVNPSPAGPKDLERACPDQIEECAGPDATTEYRCYDCRTFRVPSASAVPATQMGAERHPDRCPTCGAANPKDRPTCSNGWHLYAQERPAWAQLVDGALAMLEPAEKRARQVSQLIVGPSAVQIGAATLLVAVDSLRDALSRARPAAGPPAVPALPSGARQQEEEK